MAGTTLVLLARLVAVSLGSHGAHGMEEREQASPYRHALRRNFPRNFDGSHCEATPESTSEEVLAKKDYFGPRSKERKVGKYYPGEVWFQNFWPPCLGCAGLVMLGSTDQQDGKWTCDPAELLRVKPDCKVLSIGSNNEFGYEEHIVREYGCEIHVYDHTSEPPAHDMDGKIKFFKVGLAPEDGHGMLSLSTMIERLAGNRTFVEIVKIDCEGCEIASVSESPKALEALKLRAIHMNLETHYRLPNIHPSLKRAERMAALQDNLVTKANMVAFYKEPNLQWSRGDCVEYAMVNRHLLL